MKRWIPVVLAALVVGCGFQIPPCILDGSCLPKPSPSPEASPSPAPSPSLSPVSSPVPPSPLPASPSPEPSASPSPVPSPSASPTPAPTPVPACPRPDDATAAPNRPVQKEIGYRNTFDVSPWFEGKKITAESGCALELILTYGEFEGKIFQEGVGSGFEHQGCSLEDYLKNPSECPRAKEDFYLYVDATNSDSNWSGETYLGAGRREYCVSFKHLAHYTCITCDMGTDGKVSNCGPRHERQK